MLAAQALELPAGAEVIVPSFTFAATAQALMWNGLVPVFCDCRPDTLTLEPADVERNLTSRTAAICAAYVYGLPPDIDALTKVGERHGIPLYFDSAQGLGAEYQGRKAGAFGQCEIFSLSPTSSGTRTPLLTNRFTVEPVRTTSPALGDCESTKSISVSVLRTRL